MSRPHILYAFHGRFPDPRAAALFAAQEAISLSEFCEVTFVVPTRDTTNLGEARRQFSIPESIKLIALPTIDIYRFPIIRRFSFEVSLLTFRKAVKKFLEKGGAEAADVSWIITTDYPIVFAAKESGKKVMLEVHDFPKKTPAWLHALHLANLVLATNEWKKNEIATKFGIPTERIILERNGVDLEAFSNANLVSQKEARTKLGLSLGGTIAVYTGHLYDWKGVDTLAEAAKLLPQATIYFVGGTPETIGPFKKKYGDIPNIRIVGHRPHTEIPLWQAASDVLVLPNSAKQEISVHYTSPMKLLEYMASGRPIVASQLPSITELVDDTTAYLCAPDNAESLAAALRAAITDSSEADARASRARTQVEQFSWNLRAKRLIDHLSLV